MTYLIEPLVVEAAAAKLRRAITGLNKRLLARDTWKAPREMRGMRRGRTMIVIALRNWSCNLERVIESENRKLKNYWMGKNTTKTQSHIYAGVRSGPYPLPLPAR